MSRCPHCGAWEGHDITCRTQELVNYKPPVPPWKQPKKPTAEMEHTFHPLRRNETKDKPI